MQIFKLLPTACAVVICASFISVRADDTPVQAAARAALEQKMSELDKPQTQAPPVVVTSPGAVKVQPSQLTTKTVPAKATTPAASVAIPPKPGHHRSGASRCRSGSHCSAATSVPAAMHSGSRSTVVPNQQRCRQRPHRPRRHQWQMPGGPGSGPGNTRTQPRQPAATPTSQPSCPGAEERLRQRPIPAEATPATPPPAETKPAPMMTPVEPAAATTIASETNAAPAASGTTPAAPVATMPTEVAPATPPPTETKPAAPTPEMKPAPAVETAQPAPVISHRSGRSPR